MPHEMIMANDLRLHWVKMACLHALCRFVCLCLFQNADALQYINAFIKIGTQLIRIWKPKCDMKRVMLVVVIVVLVVGNDTLQAGFVHALWLCKDKQIPREWEKMRNTQKKYNHYINIWLTKMETKNKQQVKLMLKASFIIYIWAFRLPVCMALINKRRKKKRKREKNLNSWHCVYLRRISKRCEYVHVQSSKYMKWSHLIAVDIRLSDKSSSVAATSIFAINDNESIR